MKALIVLIAALGCLQSAVAWAQTDRTQLVVNAIQPRGPVPAEIPPLLGEIVMTRLQAAGRFTVFGSSDIAQMLDVEQQRQLMGCDTEQCLAEMAGALGVERVVVGDVGRIEGVWILTLKVLNTARATVRVRVVRRVEGAGDGLPAAAESAVDELIEALLSSMGKQVRPWYREWWVWTVAGAVVAGATTAAVLATQPERDEREARFSVVP